MPDVDMLAVVFTAGRKLHLLRHIAKGFLLRGMKAGSCDDLDEALVAGSW
jgi:hypothetical protein